MSELSEAKKRAEVASDEDWAHFQSAIELLFSGKGRRDMAELWYENFKSSHNTERGLRHEKV